jgi:hypothetical protein
MDRRLVSGIVTLVGGGLLLLGSFLPWAQVASLFGTVSVNGTEGDGKITAAVGVAVALVGLVTVANRKARLSILAPILGLVGAGAGVLDLANVNDKFASVSSSLVHPSIGIGLYLVILGGIVTLVAALFGAADKNAAQAPGAVQEGITWLAVGDRYQLGYTVVENPYYGLWDREAPGLPVHKYPYTDHGKHEAEAHFARLEAATSTAGSRAHQPPPSANTYGF